MNTASSPDDTSLCPSCGYDIRGLKFIEEKATCPECSEKISLAALKAIPRLKYPFWRAILIPIGPLAATVSLSALLKLGFDSVWSGVALFILAATTLIVPPAAFFHVNRSRWRLVRRERRKIVARGLSFSLLAYFFFVAVWFVTAVVGFIWASW
jgi:hypothetical protein